VIYLKEPLACLRLPFVPDTARPLRTLSVMLSWLVPLTKWLGLTQAGLSQVCITIGLSTERPSVMCIIKRWALHCLPFNWNKPYPSLSCIENSQQPFGCLTILEKNRLIGSDLGLAIITVYDTKSEMSR